MCWLALVNQALGSQHFFPWVTHHPSPPPPACVILSLLSCAHASWPPLFSLFPPPFPLPCGMSSGRGTDILLGGNPDYMARLKLREMLMPAVVSQVTGCRWCIYVCVCVSRNACVRPACRKADICMQKMQAVEGVRVCVCFGGGGAQKGCL